MVPPSSHRVSRVRRYSGSSPRISLFAYETLTPSGASSHTLQLNVLLLPAVRTPKVLLPPVWPLPLSLATTQGISVDVFSSPYLDVSVQAVPPIHLWIQCMVTGLYSGRVSPLGYTRIDACFRLPVAFRRSLRPSSAPSAKAFSLRSSSLDLLMLESSQVLTSIPL